MHIYFDPEMLVYCSYIQWWNEAYTNLLTMMSLILVIAKDWKHPERPLVGLVIKAWQIQTMEYRHQKPQLQRIR